MVCYKSSLQNGKGKRFSSVQQSTIIKFFLDSGMDIFSEPIYLVFFLGTYIITDSYLIYNILC